MSDRELLELAAKASRMEIGTCKFEWDDEANSYVRHEPDYAGISGPWNPLTDDGDALRLAVKLDMAVTIWCVVVEAQAYGKDAIREHGTHRNTATTRRAIVRAAAEIGKAMP